MTRGVGRTDAAGAPDRTGAAAAVIPAVIHGGATDTAAAQPMTPALLTYNAEGLIPAIAQQHDTREVLMLAWMDAEAVRRTLVSGRATYFSRSRREYWVKGETSGHHQRVVEVRYDCDADTLLLLVDQTGAACHTGTRSCFDGRVLTGRREPGASPAE